MINPEQLQESTTESFEATEQNHELTAQERALEILKTAPEPLIENEEQYIKLQNRLFSHGFGDAMDFIEGNTSVLKVREGESDYDIARRELAQKLLPQLENLDEEGQLTLEDELAQAFTLHASEEYQSLVDNWNNPTGLLDTSWQAVVGDIATPHECVIEGCPHVSYGSVIHELQIDNGKGRPINIDGTGKLSYDSNASHVLDVHPQTNASIELARQIIALSERGQANLQDHES